MRILIIVAFISLTFACCKDNPSHIAIEWSNDIKMKIIEDVNIISDSLAIDTTQPNIKYVSFFSKAIRTRKYGIRKSHGDTIISIFYSKNQKFELVNELCPGISRSFEGIKYEGRYLGLQESRFCNGKLKEQGFSFNGNVGVKTEWDENGNVINQMDYGLLHRLKDLARIKYN